MLRYLLLTAIYCLLALGLGFGVYYVLVALREEPETVTPVRVPLAVEAVRLEPQDVTVPLGGFGTARADRAARISAQVSGQVENLAEGLRDGIAVEQGDLLVQIDDRDYQARAQQAEAQLASLRSQLRQLEIEQQSLQATLKTAETELEIAEREYTRIMDLFEQGTSSDRELDAARVAVQRARRAVQELDRALDVIPERRAQLEASQQQAEAELAIAQLNLERCEIRAPFTGRVHAVSVDLGEQVAPGAPLLTLIDPDLMEVPIELPVSWRPRVAVGAPARLWLESAQQNVWEGHVARVAPQADEASRTFAVFIEVDNRDQGTPLLPGMFVRAYVDGPHLTDALIVPRNAIRQQRVFVAADGVAEARSVTIEQRLADDAIIAGVAPGEVVITSNLDALSDGSLVEPQLINVVAEEAESALPGPPPSAPTAASEMPAGQVP